ncbi:hypothetical protein FHX37_3590 [Haloactinospora alba]|uniref:Amidohydrolase 3 domain-containing protein n=1 Tax=Haloactinospora alba TaxID=405555 RepID=A0A543NP00_9ACTN|nr:amidohydrolase [Haloactinospora alba]TQN33564.1 hypothetical protein FHX37_3590 [Haloactinospora alba]
MLTDRTPDLVLVAERIHTLEPSETGARALAVRDGRIAAVGDERDVRHWRGPGTEVLDLGPAVLTPGLVDGHMHPVKGLDLTAGVDLSHVTTLDQLVAELREHGRGRERGAWVQGWGLDPNAFGGHPLTHAPLVRALGEDTPALVTMFDGHSALASPRALELAGVDGPRRFAQRAEVVCDDDGRPTGHLLELPAYELVQRVLPPELPSTRRSRLSAILERMAASGLTAGNVMDFDGDSGELVSALEEEGELPLRLRFAPMCMPGADAADLDRIVEQQRLRGRRWSVDGVKFMIDGTVDGGTAWLDEPDVHGESTRSFWPDPDEYTRALRHLSERGVPTATHAIGDAGVRHVLDAIAGVAADPPRVPHRVEHLETLPSELVPRFRALDVTASMQPAHCAHYTRADHTDNWSHRLGPRRAGRAFRCRDLRDTGARLALGSDWPIASFDPRATMADAQLRRPALDPESSPVRPEQALSARMALEGYTIHAATAAGTGDTSGTIAPGKRADLTAFTVDPLRASPDELAQAPIALTVVAGRVAHRGGGSGR